MKKILLGAVLLLPLAACETIDDLGRHMPVVGERCENWQCFTESGQAQSNANKRTREAHEASRNQQPRTQLNGEQNAATAPAQPQPAAAVKPTAEQDGTPYDLSPEQIQHMP